MRFLTSLNLSFITRLCGLCLIMTLPLWAILAFKWPVSFDMFSYAADLRFFSAQFWAGELYPRWLTGTNAGFGSPVFLFYSPVAFYVMSFFEFVSPIDPYGFGRIVIGIMLSILVSGTTSYHWLRYQLPKDTAEKGALLYAGFPYLLLHIYGSFAIGQLWGIALFPLLMDGAENLLRKGWKGVPKLAIAYTLLCCTHLPSTLMFFAIPWLYITVFSHKGRKLKTIALATIAALLGVALAMIYLLPAALNKPYIASNHFLDANLVYANDFLDRYSQLGMVAVILPLMALYFEMPKSYRASGLTAPVRFWLAVEAGFLFMALPLSKPIWDAVYPLRFLQFPFRFFLAMLPGTVFIAIRWLPYAKSRYSYQTLFLIGLTCAVVYSEEIAFFHSRAPIASVLDNNLVAPEYQTRWMQEHNINFRRQVPDQFKKLPDVTFISGSGSADITLEDSRNITLRANITSPEATISLHRFYFPGWISNPHIPISEHDALLSLQLPEGSYDITLTIPWFAGEQEGMIISLGALIILMAFIAFSRLQDEGNGHINSRSSTNTH